MKPYERKQLLARIDRDGATIGTRIPESITVEGERLSLREFVFEARSRDAVPTEERDRVEAAKRNLRRERIARRERIENGDIGWDEGEQLTKSIIGIDRALGALSALGTTDIEAEAEAHEAADRKRWASFLNRALGREGASRGRGRSP